MEYTIAGMKLADYLRANTITDQEFADRIGRDRTTVLRWRTGATTPDLQTVLLIGELTAGAVQPQDFVASARENAA